MHYFIRALKDPWGIGVILPFSQKDKGSHLQGLSLLAHLASERGSRSWTRVS